MNKFILSTLTIFFVLSIANIANANVSYDFKNGQVIIHQTTVHHVIDIQETVPVGEKAEPFTCYVSLVYPKYMKTTEFFNYETWHNTDHQKHCASGCTPDIRSGDFYNYNPTEIIRLSFKGSEYPIRPEEGMTYYMLRFQGTTADLNIVCLQNKSDPEYDVNPDYGGFLFL